MTWAGLLFVSLIVLAILQIVPWYACLIVPFFGLVWVFVWLVVFIAAIGLKTKRL